MLEDKWGFKAVAFFGLLAVIIVVNCVFSLTQFRVVIRSTGRVAASSMSILSTDGKYIKDESGGIVHLHGVCKNEFIESGTGAFEAQYWGQPLEDVYRWHLSTLQSWGCNFIACGVEVMWWVQNKQDIRANFQFFVQLAEEYYIYVGIGVFGWDYPGSWGGSGGAREIMANPHTYINDFWLSVSDTFKHTPNIIYASPIEVANSGVYPELTEPEEMNQYYSIVVDAVRAIRNNGDDHIFVYHEGYCSYPVYFDKPATEGGEMIRQLHNEPLDPANPEGPKLGNIAYDAHVYRFHGTFGNDDEYFDFNVVSSWEDNDGVYRRDADSPLFPDRTPQQAGLEQALRYFGYYKILDEYSVPIIMWEGGACTGLNIGGGWLDSPNTWEEEVLCWRALLQLFNELNISYAAFWWRNAHPWALMEPVDENSDGTYDSIQPLWWDQEGTNRFSWGQEFKDALAQFQNG